MNIPSTETLLKSIIDDIKHCMNSNGGETCITKFTYYLARTNSCLHQAIEELKSAEKCRKEKING